MNLRYLPIALVPAMASSPLRAQQVGGAALVYNVQHRVLYGGAVREQTGMWLGAEGWVRTGRFQVAVRGLMGKLSGTADPANPERDVRASSLALLLQAAPWVEVGAEAEARRFESGASVAVWRLIGPVVRFRVDLGIPGLEAHADGSYFAAASVAGGTSIQPAARAAVGVRFAAPAAPVYASVGYRFERFDVAATGGGGALGASADRLEQFRGVVAGIGVRLGR